MKEKAREWESWSNTHMFVWLGYDQESVECVRSGTKIWLAVCQNTPPTIIGTICTSHQGEACCNIEELWHRNENEIMQEFCRALTLSFLSSPDSQLKSAALKVYMACRYAWPCLSRWYFYIPQMDWQLIKSIILIREVTIQFHHFRSCRVNIYFNSFADPLRCSEWITGAGVPIFSNWLVGSW